MTELDQLRNRVDELARVADAFLELNHLRNVCVHCKCVMLEETTYPYCEGCLVTEDDEEERDIRVAELNRIIETYVESRKPSDQESDHVQK